MTGQRPGYGTERYCRAGVLQGLIPAGILDLLTQGNEQFAEPVGGNACICPFRQGTQQFLTQTIESPTVVGFGALDHVINVLE